MDAKYVYVGHIIKKSGNYGDIDDYINDEPEPTPQEVSERIKKELGIDTECGIQVFTHYR